VTATRYSIDELASLGGVSRRTVRYYVQENLIPAPLGLGRGRHYTPEHLQQLLRVKALQESGRTLDEIRRATGIGRRGDLPWAATTGGPLLPTVAAPAPSRSLSSRSDDRHDEIAPDPFAVAVMRSAAAGPADADASRTLWRRFRLSDGVELHVAHDVRMPSARQLAHLTDWIRSHLARTSNDNEP
jgi:DNA-binding transcriptional MerR regulator